MKGSKRPVREIRSFFYEKIWIFLENVVPKLALIKRMFGLRNHSTQNEVAHHLFLKFDMMIILLTNMDQVIPLLHKSNKKVSIEKIID
jgi:hypothetical protein